MWNNRHPHSLLVGMQNSTATLKDSLAVSCKTNILLPYKPAIICFGIYPKELKTYNHTKTYTGMFIAGLFKIAKTCKPLRCPTVGEWIDKMWYTR